MLRALGRLQKPPHVSREGVGICAVVRGTTEGGVGGAVKDRRIHGFIIGGNAVFYQDTPLPNPPPSFQVLPAAQAGRIEISSVREYSWLESGVANQALVGYRR